MNTPEAIGSVIVFILLISAVLSLVFLVVVSLFNRVQTPPGRKFRGGYQPRVTGTPVPPTGGSGVKRPNQ